jgi:hypothetical protein
MPGRKLLSSFLAIGWLSAAAPARAQTATPPPSPSPSPNTAAADDGTVTESVSYAPTVGLLYGIGYAGMATGFWLTRPQQPAGVRLAGAIVLPSGAITALFGPMLAHFDHGFLGKGLLSPGGQVAAALLGISAGYGVAKIAGADETTTAALIGGASAHITWALFDTFYLAREERVLERTIPAPSYSLVLDPEGFRAGVGFEF